MSLRLIQLKDRLGARRVAARDDAGCTRLIEGIASAYELASVALSEHASLDATIADRLSEERLDLAQAQSEGRLLAPIDHPDPAHLYLTGTGLTHLGSAEGREQMHRAAAGGTLTDSMRMFLMGLEGGKPAEGAVGVQPEWFYKGDGSSIVAPGAALPLPEFALDGGEEPEIAGVYLIDADAVPRRLGFCLANEFSDHVTERRNYLWLAHSKLRAAALGPELMTGELPADIRGSSRIRRAGRIIWEKAFLTGEANMSHSIRNLEHHHFKYPLFRRPGDVHVHFFGTATISCVDGIETAPGDVFEIEAPPFHLPACNPIARVKAAPAAVRAL